MRGVDTDTYGLVAGFEGWTIVYGLGELANTLGPAHAATIHECYGTE